MYNIGEEWTRGMQGDVQYLHLPFYVRRNGDISSVFLLYEVKATCTHLCKSVRICVRHLFENYLYSEVAATRVA